MDHFLGTVIEEIDDLNNLEMFEFLLDASIIFGISP
jgi:hypothetical protein